MNKQKTKVIKSLTELKKLAGTSDGVECVIALNFGLYSRKHVYYSRATKSFGVYNFIDDTEVELTEKEIMDKRLTNIGVAIKQKALILT